MVFDHVGLLVNGPPNSAGVPFIQSSDDFNVQYLEHNKLK